MGFPLGEEIGDELRYCPLCGCQLEVWGVIYNKNSKKRLRTDVCVAATCSSPRMRNYEWGGASVSPPMIFRIALWKIPSDYVGDEVVDSDIAYSPVSGDEVVSVYEVCADEPVTPQSPPPRAIKLPSGEIARVEVQRFDCLEDARFKGVTCKYP